MKDPCLHDVHIKGPRLEIVSCRPSMSANIAPALLYPGAWHSVHWGIRTPSDLAERLRAYQSEREGGRCHPLVIQAQGSGEVMGITRFMNLDRANRGLEIGGTWMAQQWQRTFANTEAKYLLLRHCFETLDAIRVEFRVDSLNHISQAAVKRIGAKFEGELRQRQILPNGAIRDGHVYSVIATEWPATKQHLATLL